ncbi:preprotein translocase subunit SecE [Mycoplasma mycoides]|uniref:preprotein translocase subunit SecE n=1 Tax=Mycoplasma mycoides TaxID=2102 RepID=UPI00034D9898|nr:preprotein translocase subunit SecE [Mycoplasma mycoides]EXU60099.1 Preprotein translocase, SecE subunit [Mycoplasma mycoides subsp. capri PG3]QVJ95415.1 preprotein translocase subunit SecE [Mycoplasma mycoides subsp. capri]QVK04348.1 preprotein translocase subunit SecE [Mycoplasma mycoides subsp. capri]QVK05137.1 preprotein translocase subunit SecE [Mycoplasma mycoides subsp. capri]
MEKEINIDQVEQIEQVEHIKPKNTQKISKTTKKKLKVKKEKEPKNFRKWFKELPVRMSKEFFKIRWTGSGSLGKKFLIVIIFMSIFALLFFGVDVVIQYLFRLIKAI